MSEKITGVRCEGPCGRIKHIDDFGEVVPGRRRRQCKDCFNEQRVARAAMKGVTPRNVKCVSPGKYTPGCPCAYCKRTAIRKGDQKAPPIIRAERLEAVVEHRLKAENRELKAKNAELAAQLNDNSEYSEIIKAALAAPMQQPRIHPRERKSNLREGTPLVLASDWHIEEEVKPERVAFRNRYNLDIAAQRMQRFFEATRWGIRQQRDTFKIRDLVLWLGGDFITNFLHDGDAENNLLAPLDALLFWQAEVVKGLLFLLEDPEIEQFVIPMNDGNHGRESNSRRINVAKRTQHSLEVFAYAQLKLRFANEPRLKFIMPTSEFNFVDDVYGKTIRFLHGDVFNYNGGVGGLTIPLLRAKPRWDSVKRADLTCMGHWHQRICLPDLMVNGSLIGYNAFAMSKGFAFESPSQSMRMLDSRRWTGADIPLYVAERADDAANKRAA